MVDSQRTFDAAVDVIRSLPKSGSFVPSNEMMLKFYGYYKQAKEGPCNEAKPSFWDVVKKAKWDAWSKLGNTSKEEAMNCYVHELKEVIQTMSVMPEADQASQFINALEPFYKIAYGKGDIVPPIFNVLNRKKDINGSVANKKINGHIKPVQDNEVTVFDTSPNASPASILHIPEQNFLEQSDQPKHDNSQLQIHEVLKKHDPDARNNDKKPSVPNDALNEVARVNGESKKSSNQDDDDDEDDDELFCDSLGPESLQEPMMDVVHLSDRNRSSFSDVEVLEKFDCKRNGSDLSSSPHSEKIVQVHFEDLDVSREDNRESLDAQREHGAKEYVEPGHRGSGSSAAGVGRKLPQGTTSGGKSSQRNVPYSERSSARYSQRYRRRSQESDSDESPGRSDHNSGSERGETGIDRIAELLMGIHVDMKEILDRLKRLETSIQQSHLASSYLEIYKPSKTFVFLVIWPVIVNFLAKFLRRRFSKKT